MGLLARLPAWVLGCGLGAVFFVGLHLVSGRPLLPSPASEEAAPAPPPVPDTPDALFATNCSACHQLTGLGLPGAFPPLAGSGWATEDPETPIRVVLAGLQGEIDVKGVTFNGVMPPLGHLSDQQIALILTHVRSSFGNEASAVQASQVAAVRAALGGRATPIGGGEELSRLRGE